MVHRIYDERDQEGDEIEIVYSEFEDNSPLKVFKLSRKKKLAQEVEHGNIEYKVNKKN